MAALSVAAGRFGEVAAVARGGLVDAVGAVVGAHGLAQPEMVGLCGFSASQQGMFLYLLSICRAVG